MQDYQKELSVRFLAERHGLQAFIYGMVRDYHVAEDIFQEVWIRLANTPANVVTIENLAGWCRGVARNLILHHWRDIRNDKVIPNSDLLDMIECAFYEAQAEKDLWETRRQAMMECAKKIPLRSKQLFAMRYINGKQLAEIAQILRRSRGSILVAFSGIRKLLSECVARRLKAEGVA